ncbi:hypothetical protein NYQ25_05090 [Curtobacterium flaccumfaciens pv. flaccumfaciens]|uniref:hypothetical protein n=1 Tax=Curtobacterium flaccumfaciens TaxID=2035 RepID=UPI00217D1B6C|nr:hypothetical protein [Curtobacterium flaccumfaciens]MCS6584343.1 hypothetical protein [Curtobacterium flaccumfaciens pv. flaccumfaciens]
MHYRPSNVVPRDWDRVKNFALQAVLDAGPSNATVGLRMLSTVAHYIVWANNDEHVPLDRDELFHATLLGKYIRMRAPKKQSGVHKTLHSLLFRVATAVADVDHNRKKRGRISHGVVPYSAAELAELESWAIARKNSTHRRYAKTFLALSGGAGLQSVECAHVRGRDIILTPHGYSVRVTGRYPRTVPIQTEWTSYIDDVIDSFNDDDFVLFPGQTDEVRPRTLKWFCVGEHPAPFAQRLRDTWVLSQIPVLPLGVLMHAAGMPDIQTLRRYLPRVSPGDLTDWDAVLRQPTARFRHSASTPAWTAPHAQRRHNLEGQVTSPVTDFTEQPIPRLTEHTDQERRRILELEADWMPKRFRAAPPPPARFRHSASTPARHAGFHVALPPKASPDRVPSDVHRAQGPAADKASGAERR